MCGIIYYCTIVSFIITYVYNVVDFPHNFVARFLSLVYGKQIKAEQVQLPKIFECALCATFWTTLIILLIFLPKYFYLAFVFAWFTKYAEMLINVIDLLLTKLFILIERILK